MTLLGKFLAMLIFILSAAFMVLALAVNASHRNWRDVVLDPSTGLKRQVEVTKTTNDQLRADRERTQAALDRERAARRTALAALQTQLDQMEQVLRQSESTVQQLEAKNTELAQLDRSRAEELQRLTEEARTLREQIRSEQEDRDMLFAETLQMTDQMNRLRGIVQQQSERNTQLMAQVSRYREVVDLTLEPGGEQPNLVPRLQLAVDDPGDGQARAEEVVDPGGADPDRGPFGQRAAHVDLHGLGGRSADLGGELAEGRRTALGRRALEGQRWIARKRHSRRV